MSGHDHVRGPARVLTVTGLVTALVLAIALSAGGAPAAPSGLTSPTHPSQDTWYAAHDATFEWDADPLPSLLDTITAGAPNVVAMRGAKAYTSGSNYQFAVFDIADPADVHLDGSVTIPIGQGRGIALSGDYAYLAMDNGTVRVLDVRNSAAPSLAGTLTTGSSATYTCDVAVAGDTLYVADYGDTKIYDISKPTSPTLLGIADTVGASSFGVAVAGDTMYVGGDGEDLCMFDVSDPTTPVFLGSDAHTGEAHDVVVDGDYAFTAGGDSGGVTVVDVSDPGAPVDIGYLDIPGGCYGLSLWGDTLYAAQANGAGGGSGGSAWVVDVSDPANPTLTGRGPAFPGVYCDEVASYGALLGSANESRGFQTLRVATPETPTALGSFGTTNHAMGVAVAGDTVFVGEYADPLGFIHAVDVSDPRSPALLSRYGAIDAVFEVEADGDLLYAAEDNYGLQVLDASDPTSLTPLGRCETPWYAHSLDVEGDIVYVGDYGSGASGSLQVVDVSDSEAPAVIGSCVASECQDVAVDGNTAIVAQYTLGARIIDVTTPTAPAVIAHVPANSAGEAQGYVEGVAIGGDYAYLADGPYGVRVLDITVPSAPSNVATLSTGAYPKKLALTGNLLYVADDSNGVTVIDVTDPRSPRLVGKSSVAARCANVAAGGELAFAVENDYDDDAGLRIFDCAAGPVAFSHSFDDTETTVPDSVPETDGITASVNAGTHGEWFFGLRSVEHRAWSWSPVASRRARIGDPVRTRHDISGDNRYETAIAISQEAFPAGSGTVIIATGQNFPDALAAAGLAGACDAPILLAMRDTMPDGLAAEIGRLDATKAYIVGGTNTLSDGLKAQVGTALTGTKTTVRLGGADRYLTADEVAREAIETLMAPGGKDWSGRAFLVSGTNYPDALVAGPVAYAGGRVTLLTKSTLSTGTAALLGDAGVGVTTITVLGGLTDAAKNAAGAIKPIDDVVAGGDRYATGAQFADLATGSGAAGWDGLGLATGLNYPDALAAAPLLGRNGSVLLLTPGTATTVNAGVRTRLQSHRAAILDIYFFGGPTALRDAVRTDALAAMTE